MFRLFETLGEAQQTQVGLAQFRQIGDGPLAALQALPYLKNLTCLMNYPLGKVVLEALAAGIFWLGHILTTIRGDTEIEWWLYASTTLR
ncbi:hypothetical protein D3C86_1423550 [compost metagenome]